ncbi:triose-phosphate isomerase [Thalassotalea sp. M1531]|uniref:Triosephosphate isomerase n=1 Tax=Thalassotalea algicola TaxID=2716224 RepID=A0A7Y0LF53_9GAMM|nr:triose-phosphate isomerase [Thalassotalea algicola]NMP33390.1 triose-phosphate isomerase [Thalassotalea algicola]
MKRQTIVAANWKMNGSFGLVTEMSQGLADLQLANDVSVVVCPSAPFLAALTDALEHEKASEHISVGAQNVSEFEQGAYTGEISTSMLQACKVQYVILGHSERRSIFKETSTQVAHKVKTALDAGLVPILCIGESEAQRTAEQTETVLAAQLQPVIDEVGIERFSHIVIAYEPVWAIGTGKTASPDMAQATHQFIRKFLADIDKDIAAKTPVLYGGSVNAKNCEALFSQTDIDGGLIGGASLKVDEFKVICSAAKGNS